MVRSETIPTMFNLLSVMVCVLRWRKSCRLGMEVPRLSKMQVFLCDGGGGI